MSYLLIKTKGVLIMAKISIKDNVVTITHNTRCKDTPAAVKGEVNKTPSFTHHFDFSAVEHNTLLQMAAANCIIAWRARHRPIDMTEEEVKALPDTIDCAIDLAPRERTRKADDPILIALKEAASKKGISVEEFAKELGLLI